MPVRQLDGVLHIEALSNGPTLAFKDMAMQLLGNLFEYELARRNEEPEYPGCHQRGHRQRGRVRHARQEGRARLHDQPHGRMSPFQQAQMFSLQDENIHNIAIEGVFDDCQDIVKAVSNDHAFKAQYKIGTVNSINWARLLAQVVYYFAGYLQATRSNDQMVSFTVPSGNFGNICAGHVARQMEPADRQAGGGHQRKRCAGRVLPHRRLPSARLGQYLRDIEPLDGHLQGQQFRALCVRPGGRDGVRTRQLFAEGVAKAGKFDLSTDPAFKDAAGKYGFVSGKSTHADRLAIIKDTFERFGQMIDTHTADGVKVAREHLGAEPMLVLETALPIKFAATIEEALGRQPDRPAKFNGIEDLPKRVVVMASDVDQVKAFIAENCK